jgi:hypothetical protein
MKYLGFEGDGCSHFTSEEAVKRQPDLIEGYKLVFEVEASCWEEASDAWHRFYHNASYRPVCPADCAEPDDRGFGISDKACAVCRGRGWVTMSDWRVYQAQNNKYGEENERVV